jgi:AcrR family transcriptional regulator
VTSTTRRWGGMTGEERAERRRSQLLDAGLEVFGVRGWAGTTVREIGAEAGLSQRYFYEQFDGREACFLAVLERIAGEVECAVRDAVGEGGTPEERAHRTLTALAELFTTDPRKLRVAFVESSATADFRRRRAALLGTFATRAARLMAALHPDPESADLESLERSAYILSGGVAEALVASVEGYRDVPAAVLVEQLTMLYRTAAMVATAPGT